MFIAIGVANLARIGAGAPAPGVSGPPDKEESMAKHQAPGAHVAGRSLWGVGALKVVLWLVAGVAGSVQFWLVQVATGGPTIPDFMGEQIVAAGGYAPVLAPFVGWAVHLGVSVSYALLFAVVVLILAHLSFPTRAGAALVVALLLAWLTTRIAPPAISVTIAVLAGQGWPAELFPVNTELGLPFWNHVVFFVLNWAIQAVGPRLLGRA